jgi:hypothetical protein
MPERGKIVERYPRICASCKHLGKNATCMAYPAEIPDSIWWEGEDHREPRGDEVDGVVWEQAPDTNEALTLYVEVAGVGE